MSSAKPTRRERREQSRKLREKESMASSSKVPNMHYKAGDSGGNEIPTGRAVQHHGKEGSGIDKKQIWSSVRWGGGGAAFCGALAGIFALTGSHDYELWAKFGILASLAFGCAFHFYKLYPTKWKIIFGIYCALFAIGSAFWNYIFPTPVRKHRFHVELVTSDDPSDKLILTNEFLIYHHLSEVSKGVPGYLIIPAKSIDQLPTLKFSIVNDSDSASEPVLVVFTVDNKFEFEANAWAGFTRNNEARTKNRSISRDVGSLIPLIGEPLPELKFKSSPSLTNDGFGLCFIQIMPRDRSDIFVMFWLSVPVSTNITRPRILRGTNDTVAVPLDIPDIRPITNFR